MRALLATLAFVAAAYATCPNSCSGNGKCGSNDACTCDPNYTGADCSQRLCPFELAWVDTPLGDVNHDGDVTTATVSSTQLTNSTVNEMWQGTQNDEAHFYAECSGKGVCDRQSGECQCYEGFTGHACQRTSCPASCSGHGVCRTLAEIASGGLNKRKVQSVQGRNDESGVVTSFTYNLWDAHKHQSCVCDPGYTGYDCSLRDCPRGDDPLTTGKRYHGNSDPKVTKVTFTLGAAAGDTVVKFGFKGWDGRTNYAFATVKTNSDAPGQTSNGQLPGASTVAGKMMLAIRDMSGGLLKRAEVSGLQTCTPSNPCQQTVTYTGRPGKQEALSVSSVKGATVTVAPAITQTGNAEEITCSGRGICNYDSGLCSCFSGQYGAACEQQNALATAGSGSSSFSSGSGVTI